MLTSNIISMQTKEMTLVKVCLHFPLLNHGSSWLAFSIFLHGETKSGFVQTWKK